MRLFAFEIAKITGGKILEGDPATLVTGVSTDSNKVKKGDLFVPIVGQRTDGHKYIESAVRNGAAAVFFSRDPMESLLLSIGRAPVIKINDTLQALQTLAQYYRIYHIHFPLIAVTGSVGKTTTRQMIALALSAGLKTYSTKGNENSQVGVPGTILEADLLAQIGVVEMGISEFGEMHRLSRMVRPQNAVITCIGDSHIAFLKSRENIMLEKLKILDFMPDGAKIFLNAQDPLLRNVDTDFLRENHLALGRNIDIRFYGFDEGFYYLADGYKENPKGLQYDFHLKGKSICHVDLKVHGEHMALNSLAAMACAVENGLDPEDAARALSSFTPLEGRGESFIKKGINIINDAYNASPQSMRAALKTLDEYEGPCKGKRVAVLSDMLELGKEELKFHEEIGYFIATSTDNVDLALAYGELSKAYGEGIAKSGNRRKVAFFHFDTYEELLKAIQKYVVPGDTMLIKGSNSMGLWKIPDEI